MLCHTGNAWHDGGRAGGNDDVFPFVGLLAIADQKAFLSSCERCRFGYDRNTCVVQLGCHTGHEGAYHLVFTGNDRSLVDGDLACQHAVFFRMERMVVGLGGLQQGLGGNAAFVEANSSQGILFKKQRVQSCTGRPLRSEIPARPTADHNQVIHKNTSVFTLQIPIYRTSFNRIRRGGPCVRPREHTRCSPTANIATDRQIGIYSTQTSTHTSCSMLPRITNRWNTACIHRSLLPSPNSTAPMV